MIKATLRAARRLNQAIAKIVGDQILEESYDAYEAVAVDTGTHFIITIPPLLHQAIGDDGGPVTVAISKDSIIRLPS